MEQLIQHIFPQHIARALCHTLVHSLWEGLLLALLTGLIIVLTSSSKAAVRYQLLAGALMLYTAAVSITFVLELNIASGKDSGFPNSNNTGRDNFFSVFVSGLSDVLKTAHEHAGIISGIWLLLVALQNVRLLLGLYILERLKRVRVKPAARYWQEKTDSLGGALGIRQAVLLLESAIAKVPLVIGHLKPIILIPVGLVNSLEPAHVEAILLHELAHIGRNDYLVGILQTVLETLFFFNPAVLWLCRLIRTEKENCCDDAVIAHTQNQLGYLQTLVHFEEYRLALPRQAVALTGTRSGMLDRLERILAGKNRSLGKMELIVLGVLLLLSTAFIAANPRNTVGSLLKTPVPYISGSAGKSLEAKRKAETAQRTRHKDSRP